MLYSDVRSFKHCSELSDMKVYSSAIRPLIYVENVGWVSCMNQETKTLSKAPDIVWCIYHALLYCDPHKTLTRDPAVQMPDWDTISSKPDPRTNLPITWSTSTEDFKIHQKKKRKYTFF